MGPGRAAQTGGHASRRAAAIDTSRCLPAAASGRYELAYGVPGETAANRFEIIAQPLGRQSDDRCGWLSLDDTGARRIGADPADAQRCWSGR